MEEDLNLPWTIEREEEHNNLFSIMNNRGGIVCRHCSEEEAGFIVGFANAHQASTPPPHANERKRR